MRGTLCRVRTPRPYPMCTLVLSALGFLTLPGCIQGRHWSPTRPCLVLLFCFVASLSWAPFQFMVDLGGQRPPTPRHPPQGVLATWDSNSGGRCGEKLSREKKITHVDIVSAINTSIGVFCSEPTQQSAWHVGMLNKC